MDGGFGRIDWPEAAELPAFRPIGEAERATPRPARSRRRGRLAGGAASLLTTCAGAIACGLVLWLDPAMPRFPSAVTEPPSLRAARVPTADATALALRLDAAEAMLLRSTQALETAEARLRDALEALAARTEPAPAPAAASARAGTAPVPPDASPAAADAPLEPFALPPEPLLAHAAPEPRIDPLPDPPEAALPALAPSPDLARLPAVPEPPALAKPPNLAEPPAPAETLPVRPTPEAPALAEPPAASAAPPPQTAPAAMPARVFLHVSGPAERASALLGPIEASGATLAEIRPVEAAPGFLAIRWFRSEDEDAARRLAARLAARGDVARLQDFRSYRPLPRPGTLELWLPAPSP